MTIDEHTTLGKLFNEYPFLKEKFIERNEKFKRLNNPTLFNSFGKYARIKDISKVSGENIADLLAFIKEEIKK